MTKTSPTALLSILLTILFTVGGQLLVKKGMLSVGASPSRLALLPKFILTTFTNPYVIGGLFCSVVAAVTWTIAVSRSALSFAYPFMGLAIVMVLALSGIFFSEVVPWYRWLGVLLVCAGIFIASR